LRRTGSALAFARAAVASRLDPISLFAQRQVDQQLECRRLLRRQLGSLGSGQNLVDEGCRSRFTSSRFAE
jgi:hypothetical protein